MRAWQVILISCPVLSCCAKECKLAIYVRGKSQKVATHTLGISDSNTKIIKESLRKLFCGDFKMWDSNP